jgi:putative transposase
VACHKAVQRRSWRSNCYHKAPADSFWSQLKTELQNGGSFRAMSEAHLGISLYLAYYNAESRHSALGYLAPNPVETQFQTTLHRCAA